jgi:hypothetical protein
MQQEGPRYTAYSESFPQHLGNHTEGILYEMTICLVAYITMLVSAATLKCVRPTAEFSGAQSRLLQHPDEITL